MHTTPPTSNRALYMPELSCAAGLADTLLFSIPVGGRDLRTPRFSWGVWRSDALAVSVWRRFHFSSDFTKWIFLIEIICYYKKFFFNFQQFTIRTFVKIASEHHHFEVPFFTNSMAFGNKLHIAPWGALTEQHTQSSVTWSCAARRRFARVIDILCFNVPQFARTPERQIQSFHFFAGQTPPASKGSINGRCFDLFLLSHLYAAVRPSAEASKRPPLECTRSRMSQLVS